MEQAALDKCCGSSKDVLVQQTFSLEQSFNRTEDNQCNIELSESDVWGGALLENNKGGASAPSSYVEDGARADLKMNDLSSVMKQQTTLLRKRKAEAAESSQPEEEKRQKVNNSAEVVIVDSPPKQSKGQHKQIQIFLKSLTGKTFTVKIEPSAKVMELKHILQEKEGIPTGTQRIFFTGGELCDEKSLLDYNIKNEATFHLLQYYPPPRQSTGQQNQIEIFIKNLTGRTIDVKIEPSATVMKLKHILQEIEGTPTDDQRIIFSGRQLCDEKRLLDYNITNEETLHFVLKLCGD